MKYVNGDKKSEKKEDLDKDKEYRKSKGLEELYHL
jgi:hypothetical protein